MKQPVIVFCFWSFLIICVHLWLVTWDQMDLLDVVQTYLRWHSFGVVIGRMELNLQQVTQNANFTPKMMINIINTWVWCALLLIHRSLGETQATAMIRLPSGSLVWESKAGFSIKQLMKTQRWFRTSKDRDNATTMSLETMNTVCLGPWFMECPLAKKTRNLSLWGHHGRGLNSFGSCRNSLQIESASGTCAGLMSMPPRFFPFTTCMRRQWNMVGQACSYARRQQVKPHFTRYVASGGTPGQTCLRCVTIRRSRWIIYKISQCWNQILG